MFCRRTRCAESNKVSKLKRQREKDSTGLLSMEHHVCGVRLLFGSSYRGWSTSENSINNGDGSNSQIKEDLM